MKNKIIMISVFAFMLLFILSSCGYTSKDISDLEEQWLNKYSDLEEKYYDASSRCEDLGSALRCISESYSTAYCFYDDADPSVSESEAHAAFLKIGEYLNEVGY